MYPEDSVQSYTNRWWEIQGGATAVRGRLIKTFVPYPEQKPHRLIPLGRGEDATQHQRALVRIEPFRIGQPMSGPASTLPVAALPLRPGESYFVQRGKVRPALIIAGPGDDVPRELTAGTARWLTAQTLLVAPYYGKDQDGTRGGWPQPLADRSDTRSTTASFGTCCLSPGPASRSCVSTISSQSGSIQVATKGLLTSLARKRGRC